MTTIPNHGPNRCRCGCNSPIRRSATYALGHDTKHRNEVMRRRYGTVRAMAEEHGVTYGSGRGADSTAWHEVLAQYGGSTAQFAAAHPQHDPAFTAA